MTMHMILNACCFLNTA